MLIPCYRAFPGPCTKNSRETFEIYHTRTGGDLSHRPRFKFNFRCSESLIQKIENRHSVCARLAFAGLDFHALHYALFGEP